MKYELAKRLEEAGFPQGGNGTWISPPDKLVVHNADRIYVPTLDEIIDACGDNFCSLTKINTGSNVQGWQACSDKECFVSGQGSTRDEAAGRLWLALQTKG
jgi:hypothetical protein